jgi:endoglucanase
MKKVILSILAIAVSITISAQAFLHREGKNIIDGNGNEIILRGIGLGGWILQEPYMLQVSATNQKDFRSKIEKLIGTENTDTFYAAWLANYMQKKDVDSLAAWGFNSIRLPMHYNLFTLPIEKEPVSGENTWLDKGFQLTDSLLSWCKANKIYLILDMHAAPGGQGKDAAISDYDAKLPSLWETDSNKNKLKALWIKLAERYKNEEWIGGYDLINEPNWDLDNSGNVNGCSCNKSDPLLQIYKDIITEIRKIDINHIIIVEGNCWGNRYNGMNSLATFDSNIVFSFHKYWNYNNADAISGIVNLRNSLNVPIWCGESGENSNAWFTSAIQLFEKNKIGWAWWTFKKFESISGINSVTQTADYKTLTNYLKNGGTAPSSEFAKSALLQMADNLKLEKCKTNYTVLDAMFRQTKTSETRPFKVNKIPGTIYCSDFDFGRYKIAYSDNDTADLHVSVGGDFNSWNSGKAYRNDGVDIEPCSDTQNSNGFDVGWTASGEWMQYTVNIDSTAVYKLLLRYAGQNSDAIMHFSIDNFDISGHLQLKSTGGWQKWRTDTFDNIVLGRGTHAIKLHTDVSGCNLSYFRFEYSKNIEAAPFKIVSGSTNEEGTKVVLTLNQQYTLPFEPILSDFIVNDNNSKVEILSVNPDASNKIITLELNSKILFGDTITINYTGNNIANKENVILAHLNSLFIFNNLPTSYILPIQIEAENYTTQSGLESEVCNEGGNDMGHTNIGDYLDYKIIVKKAGIYKVEFRVSALEANGSIELQLFNGSNKTVLGTFNVPATGGWQNWQTISGNVNLPAGSYKLRLYVKTPEFNTNWLRFSLTDVSSNYKKQTLFRLFPNPCNEYLTVQSNTDNFTIQISDITGRICAVNSSYLSEGLTSIYTKTLKTGIYSICLKDNKNVDTEKFVVSR